MAFRVPSNGILIECDTVAEVRELLRDLDSQQSGAASPAPKAAPAAAPKAPAVAAKPAPKPAPKAAVKPAPAPATAPKPRGRPPGKAPAPKPAAAAKPAAAKPAAAKPTAAPKAAAKGKKAGAAKAAPKAKAPAAPAVALTSGALTFADVARSLSSRHQQILNSIIAANAEISLGQLLKGFGFHPRTAGGFSSAIGTFARRHGVERDRIVKFRKASEKGESVTFVSSSLS